MARPSIDLREQRSLNILKYWPWDIRRGSGGVLSDNEISTAVSITSSKICVSNFQLAIALSRTSARVVEPRM